MPPSGGFPEPPLGATKVQGEQTEASALLFQSLVGTDCHTYRDRENCWLNG